MGSYGPGFGKEKVGQRGEKGHSASLAGRRMKGPSAAAPRKTPKQRGGGKMGSVVRHVNEHAHKATTSAEGRAFSFGKWPG